jgi:hypothetical protein
MDSCSKRGRVVTQIANEMRQSIIALAGVRGWGETRERWIEKASRAAGISYRTAKSIFYEEIADPKSSVVEHIRNAVEKKNKTQESIARNEFAELATRMQRLEECLAAVDPDFHSPALDALRSAARGSRHNDFTKEQL